MCTQRLKCNFRILFIFCFSFLVVTEADFRDGRLNTGMKENKKKTLRWCKMLNWIFHEHENVAALWTWWHGFDDDITLTSTTTTTKSKSGTLTSKLPIESSSVNDAFCKWLPDKFNTFNWSNECNISCGIGPISATDSAVKSRRIWKIEK